MTSLIDIGSVINSVGNVVGDIFGTKEERDKATATIEQIKLQPEIAQLIVNEAEANSLNMFVAGWRPAAGWVCVSALAYQFLLRPILMAVFTGTSVYFPTLELQDLMSILFGMLGLGAYRTYEKVAGVNR